MAGIISFTVQAPWQAMNCNVNRARLNFGTYQPRGLCQQLKNEEVKPDGIYAMRKTLASRRSRGLFFVMSSDDESVSVSSPNPDPDHYPSGHETIKHFYALVNEKNLGKLSKCISKECDIEDLSFPRPFKGRKETMKFFHQLTKSMGQNVKFRVENICKGDGDALTAAVNWHLEWKERPIPFTRGCSFYQLSEEGGKLVIRKARVLIESPIKPGGIVLTLLENVTHFFDEFPKAAEWFLEKPYAVIQFLARVYALFLAPFVNKILSGYVKLMNLVAESVFLAVKIIIKIWDFFF